VATRPSELFAISATILLVLSFLSRLSTTQTGVGVHLRSTVHVFPPSTVFLMMASLLCFSAAIYAIVPLQMNVKAGVWHYWMTAIPIVIFWACFYLFVFRQADGANTSYRLAVLLGQFISLAVILIAQTIFAANLMVAVIRLRNITARP